MLAEQIALAEVLALGSRVVLESEGVVGVAG